MHTLATRTCFTLALVVSLWCGMPLASARAPAFSLGEVTLAPEAPQQYRQVLVDTLNAELASSRLLGKRAADSLVIHARLAELHTHGSRPAKTQATVALLLAKQQSGAIFATVKGHVVVQESARERAEALAVQAAAKSALKRVSQALAR